MLLQMLEKCILSYLTNHSNYVVSYNEDLDTSDNAIILTEYGGNSLGDNTLATSRYVQVRLRNRRSQSGYVDMWTIYNSLVNLPEWRDGDFWMQPTIINIPLPMGLDKKNRQNYVLNIKIITDCKEV